MNKEQAFPGEHFTGQVVYIDGVGSKNLTEPHGGMLLRDYFAAKAMQAFALEAVKAAEKTGRPHQDTCAKAAYMFADAMLKVRDE